MPCEVMADVATQKLPRIVMQAFSAKVVSSHNSLAKDSCSVINESPCDSISSILIASGWRRWSNEYLYGVITRDASIEITLS